MAILKVYNISEKDWGGCRLSINGQPSITLPPSAKKDLKEFGKKVTLQVNGVLLKINGSNEFSNEKGDVITAKHSEKGNFQVTLEKRIQKNEK